MNIVAYVKQALMNGGTNENFCDVIICEIVPPFIKCLLFRNSFFQKSFFCDIYVTQSSNMNNKLKSCKSFY